MARPALLVARHPRRDRDIGIVTAFRRDRKGDRRAIPSLGAPARVDSTRGRACVRAVVARAGPRGVPRRAGRWAMVTAIVVALVMVSWSGDGQWIRDAV